MERQDRLRQLGRVCRVVHNKIVKTSVLAHWAALVAGAKLTRMQQLAAECWRRQSAMARAFFAWREAWLHHRLLRGRVLLATGGAQHAGPLPSALDLSAHWRLQCPEDCLLALRPRFEGFRSAMAVLEAELRRLSPHLRFFATEDDCRWAGSGGGRVALAFLDTKSAELGFKRAAEEDPAAAAALERTLALDRRLFLGTSGASLLLDQTADNSSRLDSHHAASE